MGWPANMVNSLVGACFLQIVVSSGLSASNSLPSAPGSINELTNKKKSKGNHNRNENGKRIGYENQTVLHKKEDSWNENIATSLIRLPLLHRYRRKMAEVSSLELGFLQEREERA